MIKEITKDTEILKLVAEPATAADVPVADDLMDTLKSIKEECVGLAANMIGVNKAIIVFHNNGVFTEMFNPVIEDRSGSREVEEGCLSHDTTHKATRYQMVKIRWQDRSMKSHSKKYTGWVAQVIQHEIDHLHGILV